MSIDIPRLPPPPDIACTIDDVAAIIRARTKDSTGNEIGTFAANTRPTDVQALEAIDHAVVAVHTKVGYINDVCADVARIAVARGAAAEIELSYFPEQSRSDRSVYVYLRDLYEETLSGLYDCVVGNLPDAGGGDTGYGTPTHGTFPAASGVVAAHAAMQDYPPVWPYAPVPPAPAPAPDPPEATPYG